MSESELDPTTNITSHTPTEASGTRSIAHEQTVTEITSGESVTIQPMTSEATNTEAVAAYHSTDDKVTNKGKVKTSSSEPKTDAVEIVSEAALATAKPEPVPELSVGPTGKVPLAFQLLLALANFGIWWSLFPTYQILLPNQLTLIDPRNKLASLGLITLLGGIGAIIANPLFGALSDRTTSRLGRRRPWFIAGAILSTISLLIMSQSRSILPLAIGSILFQIFLNMSTPALAALIPDKVPVRQRGIVSAFVGMTVPLATVIGIITVVIINQIQLSYYILAFSMLIFTLIFALVDKEEVLSKGDVPAFSWRSFLGGFWINPLKYPDFALTLLGRILVNVGYFTVTFYLLYFLQEVIHYESLFPGQKADQGVSLYQSLSTLVLLVAIFSSGYFSDKLQRRKPFVFGSSLVIAFALLLIALVPSWPVVLVVGALIGVGYGAFLSVDLALQTQVLPKDLSRGKDMGILSTANLFPQIIVPAIASFTLSVSHNYSVLFIVGAISAVIGAAVILPIRSVR